MTDTHNAGLQDIIDDLEEIYPTYSSLVSRADFWAIASIAAINRAVSNSNSKCTTE